MARSISCAVLLVFVVSFSFSHAWQTADDEEDMLEGGAVIAATKETEESDSDYLGVFSCDCDYRSKGWLKSGGCRISYKAPAHYACKCHYKGAWTCGGTVVHCKDERSQYCINPDRSYQSCLQGEGECGGYS